MSKNKGFSLNKNGFYTIDKRIQGVRLYERTQFRKGQEAEVKAIIAEQTAVIYKAKKQQQRPEVTFRECAIEYCLRNQHQKQIKNFEGLLSRLDEHIGHINAQALHQEHPAVKKLVAQLQAKGRKNRTINAYMEAIKRVLSAAATWRHSWCDSLTWLEAAPNFKMLKRGDARKPRPINWEQQEQILAVASDHIADEILMYVNTGLRDTELNNLRWSEEMDLPGDIMAFIAINKSDITGEDREKLIVCNAIAREVINRQRGKHDDYVFTWDSKPKSRTNNSSFKKTRARSGIDFNVHDLRHTFGHRLREAGVNEETRRELLGHGVSLTTHYSAASLKRLKKAVSSIEEKNDSVIIIDFESYKKASMGKSHAKLTQQK